MSVDSLLRASMIFVVMACASFFGACGTPGSERSAADASPSTWTVSVPTIIPHTLAEALKIIQSDPKEGPPTLSVGEASAAIFARGSDELNVRHPEWVRLVAKVCGEEGLVSEALAAKWNVTVTGYVDSAGVDGPGTLNDRLQQSRAQAAAAALVEQCGIPADRITTEKGGVAGDGPAARKVTVSYTRATSENGP